MVLRAILSAHCIWFCNSFDQYTPICSTDNNPGDPKLTYTGYGVGEIPAADYHCLLSGALLFESLLAAFSALLAAVRKAGFSPPPCTAKLVPLT